MSHYSNEHSVVINFQHMNKYVWSNIIRRHNQKLELGAKGVRKRGKLPSGIRGKARRETLFGYEKALKMHLATISVVRFTHAGIGNVHVY